MSQIIPPQLLRGKRGLVAGIANEHSIAYGCARVLHQAGAELVLTYGRERDEPVVRPLGEALGNPVMLQCDVRDEAQLEKTFAHVEQAWGGLDFVVHSIAFAPKADLHGRVVDCSRIGFQVAMDVSCYSFIRMAHLAEPLMSAGGCLITMSYYGAEKVIDHYSIMGPVKAALEASVRYIAAELGPKGIRVHAVSPGPIKTRAASGIEQFERLLEHVASRAPKRHLVSVEDVGAVTASLISDAASSLTGHVAYVDAGYHVMG